MGDDNMASTHGMTTDADPAYNEPAKQHMKNMSGC
jgi:hypothetical protein